MTKACENGTSGAVSASTARAGGHAHLVQIPDGIDEEGRVEGEEGDQTRDGVQRDPGA